MKVVECMAPHDMRLYGEHLELLGPAEDEKYIGKWVYVKDHFDGTTYAVPSVWFKPICPVTNGCICDTCWECRKALTGDGARRYPQNVR